jgi:hypothetical protein
VILFVGEIAIIGNTGLMQKAELWADNQPPILLGLEEAFFAWFNKL